MVLMHPHFSSAVTCTTPGVPVGCTPPPYVSTPTNTTITPVAPAPTYSAPSAIPSATPVTTTGLSAIPSATPETTPGSGVHIPTEAETGLSGSSIQTILINLLRWLLGIVGVVALIGFAISGVQYILAAGSDAMIETAKKNMVNSIMGIVVVLASLVIVQAIDYALRAERIL